MHPATVHGVGVITTSCISTFLRHLRNQWLESRSEVIQGHRFWYQSKARMHIPKSTILTTPLLFRLKFRRVPFPVDPSC